MSSFWEELETATLITSWKLESAAAASAYSVVYIYILDPISLSASALLRRRRVIYCKRKWEGKPGVRLCEFTALLFTSHHHGEWIDRKFNPLILFLIFGSHWIITLSVDTYICGYIYVPPGNSYKMDARLIRFRFRFIFCLAINLAQNDGEHSDRGGIESS